MPLRFTSEHDADWSVRKIAVVGPGIVGMPMAALLAHARIREGHDAPAHVVVVQRDSPTSGWKVGAINRGESVIGGVEPVLDAIVRDSVAEGMLTATHDWNDVADADLVLVSVQTDRDGDGPDYGPLMEALGHLARALANKPAGNVPVVVFESTLAPSTMATVIREHFARHGLVEGRDILLGNSPNRVMPGRLVERVARSDKLIAGLHPLTPVLVSRIYARIVTAGALHRTNSLSAEVVKTLENAYRDVRIAFAAEVVRWCDANDVDFYAVRDAVNTRIAQADDASSSATAVPSGGVLVPTIGVGGHCLPKDGVLLWWRAREAGMDVSRSLILLARTINDESPAAAVAHAERRFGRVDGRRVALLGAAYRFDSEDTRNAPTLALGRALRARGCTVTIHDPYVKPDDQNLARTGLADCFSNALAATLAEAEWVILCTGHGVYQHGLDALLAAAPRARVLLDGANLYPASAFAGRAIGHVGIGRGVKAPEPGFIDFVERSFRAMEHGVGNELDALLTFLNGRFAPDGFNAASLDEVRRLAYTCPTGCAIASPSTRLDVPVFAGFSLRLTRAAAGLG
jgi:UDP-N-acetyl-D-mannosaminuronic acid dehydrogenase